MEAAASVLGGQLLGNIFGSRRAERRAERQAKREEQLFNEQLASSKALVDAQTTAIRKQQELLGAEEKKQVLAKTDAKTRAKEVDAAVVEEKRIRAKGGRRGILTFSDTGFAGVAGGLSTALGGGSR